MSRAQSFASLLVATLVGVGSGYYIFQPLIEKSVREVQAERAVREARLERLAGKDETLAAANEKRDHTI